MKNESLLGIALELIEEVALPGAYPADARVGKFFRARRFLGSRDRRTIGDCVWTWLRYACQARHFWREALAPEAGDANSDEDLRRLEREQALPQDDDVEDATFQERRESRSAILRRAYLVDLITLSAIGQFTWDHATTAAAAGLAQIPGENADWNHLVERACETSTAESLTKIAARSHEFPVRASITPWLAERIQKQYGESSEDLARAFLEPGTIDLRVNLQKKSREHVREHLEAETGKTVELTPHSHIGLRLRERVNLTATTASRNSWIEVQDEGSQIAVLAADVQPGMKIVDACAGNGGKTLAFVDLLIRYLKRTPRSNEEGHVIACDIVKGKLAELKRRAQETRVENRISVQHVYPDGNLPPIPDADLVFIDAPCSGLGTLRRNPELKRRYQPEDIDRFAEQQLKLLERFAPLVKNHGTLVYVTCSFLEEECEAVARLFEERHPGFAPRESLWAKKNLPEGCIRGHYIRLDPVLTGTDAFFIAIWERLPKPDSHE